jgi:hypothetical protein
MSVVKRRRLRFVTRGALARLAALFFFLVASLIGSWLFMIRMPGESYHGALPPLSAGERSLAKLLQGHVEKLAGEIGERNLYRYESLSAALNYIEAAFAVAGFSVRRQGYDVRGRECYNLEAGLSGTDRKDEIVVVGAHYDSVLGCPGANDNASGVAATLSLARAFSGTRPSRTLRLVAFVNEEPPCFQTELMGSWVYAKECRKRRENITAMVSLETIGYYSDQEKSQIYPPPFGWLYPSKGNFIAFVGNVKSRGLVRAAVEKFRSHAKFPSEGGAVPGFIAGVGWSDHWSFWQEGYPAIMVTDTAPFRYPFYHKADDTPDKVDYERMARVVGGLERMIAELVGRASP